MKELKQVEVGEPDTCEGCEFLILVDGLMICKRSFIKTENCKGFIYVLKDKEQKE